MIPLNFTAADLPKNRPPAQQRLPAMRALLELGQSVWLDDLRRRMTRSGELASMIDEGLRGMTSNPSIFEHAMRGSPDYDAGLVELMSVHRSDRAVFQAIAVEDVREAADVFRPVFEGTEGTDGFVSIEISPEYARDTEGSIAEARHLWYAVDRPNVMVKIPGTRAGWPAIEHCLREGININVTLLFSVEHYRAVAEAYLRALEARIATGQRIDRLASVASMFVSRIDTEVDRRIQEAGGALAALQGRVAIANARLTYAAFLELTQSPRWRALAKQGARVQRPLWASTGTKNPIYSDIRYVQSLIGTETIATIPPATLRAFEDHGSIERTLSDDLGDAAEVMKSLADGGIDFADVNGTLENEGIQKFTASLENVLRTLAEKRAVLTRSAAGGASDSHSGP